MIDPINPRARRDTFGTKINRDHSALLAFGVPWLSILLASLTPLLPIIVSAPIVPPLAAVANAVSRATGLRVHDLPMTPDRIYGLLRAAE